METSTHIKTLLKKLSEGLFEKQNILAMALLSAVAEESIFLLGPPGTAKSLVARRLKLAFKDGKSFEYLMSRFSTPDEIFGPVSISLLKNEDRYERVVDGFMPTADIVFLDEIWKASPSIQNSLLTAINEKIYQNGNTTLHLPMKALIAASNELPAEDEGLEALWDRFLVRMVSNCIQNETEFFKMVRQYIVPEIEIPEDLLITEEMYKDWQSNIYKIVIPDDVCSVVSNIRKALNEEAKQEDVNAMDYYISDRRWKKCFHLMQASAFLNGRKSVDMTDMILLIHCLWNKAETIPTIIKMVISSLTAHIDRWLVIMGKDIDSALGTKSQKRTPAAKKTNNDGQFSVTNYFYYTIIDYPNGKCLFYKADYEYLYEVESGKTTNGIIYRDEEKKAWIVRALYNGTPFVYKNTTGGSKTLKVTLNKCQGGIIIGKMPYGFERQTSLDNEFDNVAPKKNIAEVVLKEISEKIYPNIDDLHNVFDKPKNMFLSDNDLKVVKKYLNECEGRIDEMRVKAQNAKQLL